MTSSTSYNSKQSTLVNLRKKAFLEAAAGTLTNMTTTTTTHSPTLTSAATISPAVKSQPSDDLDTSETVTNKNAADIYESISSSNNILDKAKQQDKSKNGQNQKQANKKEMTTSKTSSSTGVDDAEQEANIPETYNNNISGQEIIYVATHNNDDFSHTPTVTTTVTAANGLNNCPPTETTTLATTTTISTSIPTNSTRLQPTTRTASASSSMATSTAVKTNLKMHKRIVKKIYTMSPIPNNENNNNNTNTISECLSCCSTSTQHHGQHRTTTNSGTAAAAAAVKKRLRINLRDTNQLMPPIVDETSRSHRIAKASSMSSVINNNNNTNTKGLVKSSTSSVGKSVSQTRVGRRGGK